ncbi:hypothetical protein D9613_000266 [Agrocybe pediades]|uniref:F-box domain-containing protein n=1 Tax=Agrocybe pediades TaxID=84607 RepID=A0A8H4R1L0_9AGAR|nr:hypothetical protein D9613_000266 [Agrocybe pediades]
MNTLPQELKLHIFRFATSNPSRYQDTSPDYTIFEPVALRCRSSDFGFGTKQSLVLVCKEWKQIATELLYECILVGNEVLQLLEALRENGRWVRRVEVLPSTQHGFDVDPSHLLCILSRCPLVEVIVKRSLVDSVALHHTMRALPRTEGFPILQHLRRLDWWLPWLNPTYQGFVSRLIAHAPNLSYLTSAGGFFGWREAHLNQPGLQEIEEYANIRTLRFEIETLEIDARAAYPPNLRLPNLTHLVVGVMNHSASAATASLLQTHGHLIQTLSFIDIALPKALSFLLEDIDPQIPQKIFNACPNITEFCTTLRMGTLLYSHSSTFPNNAFKSLRCIYITLDDTAVVDSAKLALLIIKNRAQFPALNKVVFGGEEKTWKSFMCYMMLRKYAKSDNSFTLEFR